MRKLFFLFLSVVSFANIATSATLDDEMPLRADIIKIHVQSRTVEIVQKLPEGWSRSKHYRAATPAIKNSKDVPFGIIGTAYKIILNPSYIPTKKHPLREKDNKVKNPKKLYAPGESGNPLGSMKLYFAFSGIDKTLSFGMHTTNIPSSIGHRASEGCARISDDDADEIFGILLTQNGFDAAATLEQAKEDRSESITIKMKKENRPKVVYLND